MPDKEFDQSQEVTDLTLPVELQLGEQIFGEALYLENYIVTIEIYKPKDKTRRPTIKTINRIFRKLGEVQIAWNKAKK